MQLITEKISIPKERPRLTRHRLIDLLRNSLELFSVTIISGRTGMGKTSLMADFAMQCGRPVAWYRVDASDNDPHIFFAYLIESLQSQCGRKFNRALLALPEQVEEADIVRLAESLIYELQEAQSEPSVLIIEDLHLIYDEWWVVPFFSRFIPLLPESVHLFLVARSIIPVPLWRMRSKQTLLNVDEYSLMFTQDEIARLLVSYGLDESQATEIFKFSRGRASVVDEIA
ncbi:MAG TPA: AAA family ATPase, partial [Blastocatellia bacterium]|nr:AAA family ATPase [Blastocatellia bacterium]